MLHQTFLQLQHPGDVDNLKPGHRLALARDGYALVKCDLAVFNAEASFPRSKE